MAPPLPKMYKHFVSAKIPFLALQNNLSSKFPKHHKFPLQATILPKQKSTLFQYSCQLIVRHSLCSLRKHPVTKRVRRGFWYASTSIPSFTVFCFWSVECMPPRPRNLSTAVYFSGALLSSFTFYALGKLFFYFYSCQINVFLDLHDARF